MRLLVITASYPPYQVGGYEIRCKDVVDSLSKRGHEILILTSRVSEKSCETHEEELLIERKLHLKSKSRNILSQIYKDANDLKFIDRKVKEYKPDIIYLWGIQPLSNAILPYFSRQNIQIVYDEGGGGLLYLTKIHNRGLYFYKNEKDSFIKNTLKEFIYLLVSLVTANLIVPHWTWPQSMRIYFNCNSALKYSQEGGVPVENARVIYSGIDVQKFPFQLREGVGSPVHILLPGRIKPIKGTKDSLDLVKELLKRGIKVKLRIVGKIQSEEYFTEIKTMIKKDGLDDVIEYLPMVPQLQLAEFYRNSDICFFPSYFQTGFSRISLEAMASGCALITYGNEGSKEIIHDHETGFVISEGNFVEAADVIVNLITDAEKYKKIVMSARRQIEQEHEFDRYIDSIEEYLVESLQADKVYAQKAHH
ncbi:glycosyltransferase family 4 protein [Levilinea saccharolytica]|uniref:glycosyltransferase family 4 protein n=1 Tax=Levilinea saccharolytica TaxID=229921 RepID=UPI0009463256|nr:glycosyltransferase family 4 protein [Levilinea saccharolytica]GAP18822.1 glycosyltransferase [Levilinea saccharolytica]